MTSFRKRTHVNRWLYLPGQPAHSRHTCCLWLWCYKVRILVDPTLNFASRTTLGNLGAVAWQHQVLHPAGIPCILQTVLGKERDFRKEGGVRRLRGVSSISDGGFHPVEINGDGLYIWEGVPYLGSRVIRKHAWHSGWHLPIHALGKWDYSLPRFDLRAYQHSLSRWLAISLHSRADPTPHGGGRHLRHSVDISWPPVSPQDSSGGRPPHLPGCSRMPPPHLQHRPDRTWDGIFPICTAQGHSHRLRHPRHQENVECPQDNDQHRLAFRRTNHEDSKEGRCTGLTRGRYPEVIGTFQQTLHQHEHGSLDQSNIAVAGGEGPNSCNWATIRWSDTTPATAPGPGHAPMGSPTV